MGAEGFQLMLNRMEPEALQMMVRVRLGGIMDQLEAAVRRCA